MFGLRINPAFVFRNSTGKLIAWLDTASSLNQHERVSQYTNLKAQFSADLKALMEDTRAWKEMGMQEAKVRFHDDTDDGTTGWNPFLKWLAARK